MSHDRSESIAWAYSYFAQVLHVLKEHGELRLAVMFEKAATEMTLLADNPLRGNPVIQAPSPETMQALLRETVGITPKPVRPPLSSFAGDER